MKALVVGCGYMGRIHSNNLRLLGVEVMQYDVAKEKCDSYVENPKRYIPDLIVIATPIKTHYEVFMDMYRHFGCTPAYFIEKPVVAADYHFRDILHTGCEIFVGHQLRYSEFYALIKRELDSSSQFSVDFAVHSPSDPEAGLVIDTNIHFVDLAVYYLGPPKEIEARGNKNDFDILLLYDKGQWRIRGELKDYYRIEFTVNGKRGVSNGFSLTFDGEVRHDVDPYRSEIEDVVNYLLRKREGTAHGVELPRIHIQSLRETYQIIYEILRRLSRQI